MAGTGGQIIAKRNRQSNATDEGHVERMNLSSKSRNVLNIDREAIETRSDLTYINLLPEKLIPLSYESIFETALWPPSRRYLDLEARPSCGSLGSRNGLLPPFMKNSSVLNSNHKLLPVFWKRTDIDCQLLF